MEEKVGSVEGYWSGVLGPKGPQGLTSKPGDMWFDQALTDPWSFWTRRVIGWLNRISGHEARRKGSDQPPHSLQWISMRYHSTIRHVFSWSTTLQCLICSCSLQRDHSLTPDLWHQTTEDHCAVGKHQQCCISSLFGINDNVLEKRFLTICPPRVSFYIILGKPERTTVRSQLNYLIRPHFLMYCLYFPLSLCMYVPGKPIYGCLNMLKTHASKKKHSKVSLYVGFQVLGTWSLRGWYTHYKVIKYHFSPHNFWIQSFFTREPGMRKGECTEAQMVTTEKEASRAYICLIRRMRTVSAFNHSTAPARTYCTKNLARSNLFGDPQPLVIFRNLNKPERCLWKGSLI